MPVIRLTLLALLVAPIGLGGCVSLVGIQDEQTLACQNLDVVTDTGLRIPVTPAFVSNQPSYHVAVGSDVSAVAIEIACSDPAASITAGGSSVTNGKSKTIDLPSPPISVVVTADTAPPQPMVSYVITVNQGGSP